MAKREGGGAKNINRPPGFDIDAFTEKTKSIHNALLERLMSMEVNPNVLSNKLDSFNKIFTEIQTASEKYKRTQLMKKPSVDKLGKLGSNLQKSVKALEVASAIVIETAKEYRKANPLPEATQAAPAVSVAEATPAQATWGVVPEGIETVAALPDRQRQDKLLKAILAPNEEWKDVFESQDVGLIPEERMQALTLLANENMQQKLVRFIATEFTEIKRNQYETQVKLLIDEAEQQTSSQTNTASSEAWRQEGLERIEPNERQQRKLIKALLASEGDMPGILAAEDVEVSPEEHTKVMLLLSNPANRENLVDGVLSKLASSNTLEKMKQYSAQINFLITEAGQDKGAEAKPWEKISDEVAAERATQSLVHHEGVVKFLDEQLEKKLDSSAEQQRLVDYRAKEMEVIGAIKLAQENTRITSLGEDSEARVFKGGFSEEEIRDYDVRRQEDKQRESELTVDHAMKDRLLAGEKMDKIHVRMAKNMSADLAEKAKDFAGKLKVDQRIIENKRKHGPISLEPAPKPTVASEPAPAEAKQGEALQYRGHITGHGELPEVPEGHQIGSAPQSERDSYAKLEPAEALLAEQEEQRAEETQSFIREFQEIYPSSEEISSDTLYQYKKLRDRQLSFKGTEAEQRAIADEMARFIDGERRAAEAREGLRRLPGMFGGDRTRPTSEPLAKGEIIAPQYGQGKMQAEMDKLNAEIRADLEKEKMDTAKPMEVTPAEETSPIYSTTKLPPVPENLWFTPKPKKSEEFESAGDYLRKQVEAETAMPEKMTVAESRGLLGKLIDGYKRTLEGAKSTVEAVSERFTKSKEYLNNRAKEMDSKAEKMSGKEKWFRGLGEKYDKLSIREKLGIGVTLGLGAAVFATTWPVALGFTTLLGVQRAYGLSSMFTRIEKDLQEKKVGEKSTQFIGRKERAMLDAMLYTVAMGAAIKEALVVAEEQHVVEHTREWLGDMFEKIDTFVHHAPAGVSGGSAREVVGKIATTTPEATQSMRGFQSEVRHADMAIPEGHQAAQADVRYADMAIEEKAAAVHQAAQADVRYSDMAIAEKAAAVHQAAQADVRHIDEALGASASTAEVHQAAQTDVRYSDMAIEKAAAAPAAAAGETATAATVIETGASSRGYEGMLQNLMKQLPDNPPENLDPKSDLARLFHAKVDPGEIHRLAIDHDFFKGGSVRIDPSAHMMIVGEELKFTDALHLEGITDAAPDMRIMPEASAAVPVAETFDLERQEVFDRQPIEKVDITPAQDAHQQEIDTGIDAAQAVATVESPVPAFDPNHPVARVGERGYLVDGEGRSVVDSQGQPIRTGTFETSPNTNLLGVEVSSMVPHAYAGTGGEAIVYGGSHAEQMKIVSEYLTKNPDGVIYGADQTGKYRVSFDLVDGKIIEGPRVPRTGFLSIFSRWMSPPEPNDFKSIIK